jgi:arginase
VKNPLTLIGVPSSAGAYAPGQEQAPAALRLAGLIDLLDGHGVAIEDYGDVPGFRWRADKDCPRAMNAQIVASVARETSTAVHGALARDRRVLVLGGDCTIELGTVAGALRHDRNVGLLYIDLDSDLNTPTSTTDGALDWMGVAHMLAIPDTLTELTSLGPCTPMLRADQVLYFSTDNVEPFERDIIDKLSIANIRLKEVVADPVAAAHKAVNWATRFDRLLIHLDVDVLDYVDMPLAENTRRNWGLRFEELMMALRVVLRAPNWSTLTICELNPDHGEADGSTLRRFADSLAAAIANAAAQS